jgi:hypothetical protein
MFSARGSFPALVNQNMSVGIERLAAVADIGRDLGHRDSLADLHRDGE